MSDDVDRDDKQVSLGKAPVKLPIQTGLMSGRPTDEEQPSQQAR